MLYNVSRSNKREKLPPDSNKCKADNNKKFLHFIALDEQLLSVVENMEFKTYLNISLQAAKLIFHLQHGCPTSAQARKSCSFELYS